MNSVVIVNWNSGPLLSRCLRSLQEHAPECEVVVVDNASRDNSLEMVSTQPELKILRCPENRGFAAACNLGWRASFGKQVLFLNPDTECRSGAVTRLAEALTKEPDIWAAGGRLVGNDGKDQVGFNVRAFPDVGSVAAEMLFLDEVLPSNPWTRRYRMTGRQLHSGSDVEQPAAACLMLRREALERLDGFDENFYPAWFEDVDLCRRIRDQGGRIVFEHSAIWGHHGGYSLRLVGREEFLRHFHTNQLRYFRKHHGPGVAGRIRSLIVTGLCLRAVLSLIVPLAPGATRISSAAIFWRAARHFTRISAP